MLHNKFVLCFVSPTLMLTTTFTTDLFTKPTTLKRHSRMNWKIKKRCSEKRNFCCKKFYANCVNWSTKLKLTPTQTKASNKTSKKWFQKTSKSFLRSREMKTKTRKILKFLFLKFCRFPISENRETSKVFLRTNLDRRQTKKRFLGGRGSCRIDINSTITQQFNSLSV